MRQTDDDLCNCFRELEEAERRHLWVDSDDEESHSSDDEDRLHQEEAYQWFQVQIHVIAENSDISYNRNCAINVSMYKSNLIQRFGSKSQDCVLYIMVTDRY